MKALILNSGTGSRMGDVAKVKPKCLTELSNGQTILSRQLEQLSRSGIKETIITTGCEFFAAQIEKCAYAFAKEIKLLFVNNPNSRETNYIFSIYLAREALDDDILLIHGDLVLDDGIIHEMLMIEGSALTVSSTQPLTEKDFKAVITNGLVSAVGVEKLNNALSAQPFYKLLKTDWMVWLEEICRFIENGDVKCYAEKAFNNISAFLPLQPFDVKDSLCAEIDTPDDLLHVNQLLRAEGMR